MPRTFNTTQLALLQSDEIQARMGATWYMDSGTYYFCDDVNDLVWNGNTYIGANAFASAVDVRSAANAWAAESITINIDGTRMLEAGISDPASFFQNFLSLNLANRRVDLDLLLMGPADPNPVMSINLYAGKINNAKLIDPNRQIGDAGVPKESICQVVLDSLAVRYQWIVGRSRSHEDQLEIDPTDMFFSFVHENQINQQTLYWGKKTPPGMGTQATTSTNTLAGYHFNIGVLGGNFSP